MAFGQAAGPPASGRRVQQLLELLQDAGHVDFRDARGPMGFTQRQANGKFTAEEADAFIEQLETAAYESDQAGSSAADADEAPSDPEPVRLSRNERVLRDMPADLLAAELQRRGWAVMEP